MAPVTGSTGTVMNAGIKPPLGCGTARREAACAGRTLPAARNALAKIGDFGEARCRQTSRLSPACRDMRARRFRRVCYVWVSVSRPRANGAVRAADSPRDDSVHPEGAAGNLPCDGGAAPEKGKTLGTPPIKRQQKEA